MLNSSGSPFLYFMSHDVQIFKTRFSESFYYYILLCTVDNKIEIEMKMKKYS